MRIEFACLLLAVALSSFAVAGPCPAPTPLREGISIPSDVARVGNPMFSKDPKYSEINLPFTNTANKPVISAFVIVDFWRDSNERVLSVPTIMIQRRMDVRYAAPMRLTSLQIVDHIGPIKPAESLQLHGYSATSIRTCPDFASITYVKVVYTDGSEFNISLPNWHSDPMAFELPQANAPGENFQGVAEIEIQDSGRVYLSGKGTLSGSQTEFLREATKQWRFVPAMAADRLINSRLQLVVLLASSCIATTFSPPSDLERWTTVEFCRTKADPRKVDVAIGGFIP